MENLRLENDDLEPFRSKLYFLDAEGGWLDQGTGYPLLLKEKDKDILKFAKEDTEKVIYQVEITNDLQFDQQEEKIFTWFSESTNTDIALSFQNEVGAETLWQKIQEILSSKKRFFGPVTTGTCEDESLSVGSESGLIFEDFTLVLPQEDKLAKFEADLIKYTTANTEKKNLICHLLCTKNIYLENLFSIFKKAEEEQDELKLTALFRIFRHMISMAYYDLYSTLLDDEYYLKVFGILEYDIHPEKKTSIPHRKYYQEHMNLKPIAEINDPEILKTIHWNFRLIYLRDYVLGHHLDERILQFISAIIQSNYIDIIKYIQTSREFLTSLFGLLRANDLSALKMVHEICVVMKNLEVDKIGIFQLFSDYGLFEILEEILTTPPPQTPHKIVKKMNIEEEEDSDSEEIDVALHLQTMLEIIMLALVQAPLVLREYCGSERQKVLKYPLMTYMADKCTTYPDLIIQSMLLEAIKHLIDIADNGSEETSLQRTFYDQQLGKILRIYDNPSNDEVVESGKSMASDLLIYCAKQQTNELKRYLIPLDIMSKITQTFRTNSKFLILQTVQFYKLLLKCKEPEIISLLVNPLGTIINYFMDKCKDKWNLLHSSILEIFHIILQEEILVLLKSIIKGAYKRFLEDPNFADLSEKLKDKYTKLNNGEFDLALEERKQSDHSFTYNSRKGSGNFSLESPPSGNGGFWDNSMKKPSNSSPKHGENRENRENREKSVRRTISNINKSVDYDGEMDFNNETRGKEPNFMIEDIHVKKRKLDEIHSIKILNKTSHSSEVS